MSLRINQRRCSTEEYLSTLKQSNIAAERIAYCSYGINLKNACGISDLPGFTNGDVSLQDGAAQLAVTLLDLKPNIRILDACAAPGGKYCHILESNTKLKACIALELQPNRLLKIQENLTRLNLQGTLIRGDACKPEAWWDGEKFDRILLDAPCSATGVIRRHPDIKVLRTSNEIIKIVELQQQLLKSLWPLLNTNGLLVYATCSILPEENEIQIKNFCQTQHDCVCENISTHWGKPTGHGRQILPGENNMDGFFYSVLRNVSSVSK